MLPTFFVQAWDWRSIEYAWTDIRKVTERRRNFFIFLDGYHVDTVPKATLDANQLEALRSIFRDKLGLRAQLIS
jgi:hypothetical protein